MNRVFVIGISPGERLNEKATRALRLSKAIFASPRIFGIVKEMKEFSACGDKFRIIKHVSETIKTAKKATGTITILASGDPLFFGIGKRAVEELAASKVVIIPSVSSAQLAFARAGLPWDDAMLISLHGDAARPWHPEDLPLLCETNPKMLILTGGGNTPQILASYLPKKTKAIVLERLGYSDEKITRGTPSRIGRMKFSEPNVMIVLSPPMDGDRIIGLTEKDFKKEKGLITKDEARAVALHKLSLPRKGVFWDIGAGTGAVAIEAKRLSPKLDVYAIEKEASRIKDIKLNALRLNAGRINPVNGIAPGCLKDLPAPSRAFIGGGGGSLKAIINSVSRRMKKGIIVITAITIESLSDAVSSVEKQGFVFDVSAVSVAKSKKVGGRLMMRAENPVFVIRAER